MTKITKNTHKTDKLFLSSIVKLNLSSDEGRCIKVLVEHGALTSEEIARKMCILPNAVYRLTKTLINKKLVVELNTYPNRYQALPPEIAIDSLANEQIKEIELAKILTIQSLQTKTDSNNEAKIEVLTGWNNMMDKYVDLIKESKEEILIISIGEQVPDEVKLANRDALENKINIKFIIHKYDDKNKELIRSWIKMGIEVRHLNVSGFHLIVVDGKKCLLASSNPQEPQERSSVVIYGEGISKAMRQYFYNLWNTSTKVEVD